MNRIIAHVLQKTGYVAVLVGFSYVLSRAIDPGSDKPDPTGIVYFITPVITLILVLQYGAYLRRRIEAGRMIWIWLGSVAFYFGSPRFLRFYDIYWDGVIRTFVPELRFGDLLDTVGSFYSYVAEYWMPTAGSMSLIAFVASGFGIFQAKKRDAEAAASDGDKPPN